MKSLSVGLFPMKLNSSLYARLTAHHFLTLFLTGLFLSLFFCSILVDRSLTDRFFISLCITFKQIPARFSNISLAKGYK